MASPQRENGHIRIANEIAEELAKTQLSGYESRILWTIWRKTWGWGKKEDWISFSQFRDATGLRDSHISRTLKKLLSRSIVTKNGNSYSFQKDYQKWQQGLPKMVSQVTKNGKCPLEKELPKMADTKENKNTITKNTITKESATFGKLRITEHLKEKFSKIEERAIRKEVDQMEDYLLSSGKKYKDYDAFSRTWVRRVEDKLPKKVFMETWKAPVDPKEVNQEGLVKLEQIKRGYALKEI